MSTLRTCRKCGAEVSGPRCKPCRAKWSAEYHVKNRDKLLARAAKWDRDHPEEAKKRTTRWYEKNKENERLRARRLGRLQQHKRRALVRDVGGELSRDIEARLFQLQRGMCAACYTPLNGSQHLDHIMPLILRGKNIDHNAQLLHKKCNLQKREKHPIDFMQKKGFLL
jgi:5-methylcytosine-specific restriction endonuclease McrA